MIEIEKKILEMREAEKKSKERIEKQKKRNDEEKMRKERMKNHWMMMGWLTNYIEKNKYNWERRRELQERDKEMMEEYEEWREQTPEDQIESMRKEEEQRLIYERTKLDRNNWNNWRGEVHHDHDRDLHDHNDDQEQDDKMREMMKLTKEMTEKRKKWEKEMNNKNTGEEEPTLTDTDRGEYPGWSNPSSESMNLPEKLGGEGKTGQKGRNVLGEGVESII